MCQQATSNETPNEQELCPNLLSILEMARQHFLSVHGREPGDGESVFDEEPPSSSWPAVPVYRLSLGKGDEQ
jgi:hypothetical protein